MDKKPNPPTTPPPTMPATTRMDPPPTTPPPNPSPTQDEIARLLLDILRNISGQATTPRALSDKAQTAITHYGQIAADLKTFTP